MANGDSFDPGNFTGSDPNDPLIEWAKNTKPEDLAHFAHDPEAAKQNMIDQGIPPPEHHYVNGFPVDLATASAADAARGQAPIRDPSQGNVTDDTNKVPLARANPPDYSGGMGNWQGVGKAAPGAGTEPGPIFGEPYGPLAPIGRAIRDWWNAPGAQAAQPQPSAAPPMPPPKEVKPAPEPKAPGEPLDISPTQQGIADANKQLQDQREKALSDFAKTMQGIKAPTPPAPFHAGAPSVRQHTSITPTAQGLLGLLGQPGGQVPSAQAQLLARLLGRF